MAKSNNNTIEYLGIWEKIKTLGFNYLEFGVIEKEADVLNVALFGMTAKQWREANPESKGNQQMKILIEAENRKLLK